jgi:hypothetical protein
MTSQTKSSFNKVFANQPNIFGNLGEMEEGLKEMEGVGSYSVKKWVEGGRLVWAVGDGWCCLARIGIQFWSPSLQEYSVTSKFRLKNFVTIFSLQFLSKKFQSKSIRVE